MCTAQLSTVKVFDAAWASVEEVMPYQRSATENEVFFFRLHLILVFYFYGTVYTHGEIKHKRIHWKIRPQGGLFALTLNVNSQNPSYVPQV